MQRLKDYAHFLAWSAGLGYLALWCVTMWALEHGGSFFSSSGVCRPDASKVLFYWVCNPAHPIAVFAGIVNAALTITVWAPVYVAAATVRPEALLIAIPIVSAHVIGLPTALFVAVRAMLGALLGTRGLLTMLFGAQPERSSASIRPM